MGLVVVVLILVVGLLFLVFFSLQQKPSQERKDFDSQQLAFNTVSAVLQASTSCNNLRIQEVVQNCAWRNDLVCDGLDGCSFAEREISEMLNGTLVYVQQDFFFYVFTSADKNKNVLEIKDGDCSGDRTSAVYPLKFGGGELFIGLDICDAPFGIK